MTDTWRIGSACFIGGAICCAVALLVAPAFWWFGIFAGLAGGYVAYEFRQVLLAIPRAFVVALAVVQKTPSVFAKEGWHVWHSLRAQWTKVCAWARKPHPFLYPGIIITVYLSQSAFRALILPSLKDETIGLSLIVAISTITLTLSCVCALIAAIFILCSHFVAIFGARYGEGVYWIPFEYCTTENENLRKAATENGWTEVAISYSGVYRWMFKGVWLILAIVSQRIVTGIYKGALLVVYGLHHIVVGIPSFLYELVRLIHSDKRILCSIDGTLGGIIALAVFYFVAPEVPGPAEYLMVIGFGGLIGAALGIANWELVSKRHFGFGTPST